MGIIYFFHQSTIWHFQYATIHHLNICQILRPYYGCNYRRFGREASIVQLPSALNPPFSLVASRFSRFSSSNLATPVFPDRSVFGEHVKPFLSFASIMCLSFIHFPFVLRVLSLLQPPATRARFFLGRFIAEKQVASAARRYRCGCIYTNVATPQGQ